MPLHVFTSERHLGDIVNANGETLATVLGRLEIPNSTASDINTDPQALAFSGGSTLGLAIGAAWVFEPQFAARFAGPLLDFMGIDVPRYRGGAHYSWQILHGNRQGACNIQVVHGGSQSFHRGEVLARKTYQFPERADTPQKYFETAVPVEVPFILEFIHEALNGKVFEAVSLEEAQSSYFPFLNTKLNGWVDWSWSALEVSRFIQAFDAPYAGASTLWNGRRVHLKDVQRLEQEGSFHPYTRGLVIRKESHGVVVALSDGALRIGRVASEAGVDILDKIALGDRFFTPQKFLEEALGGVTYTDRGPVKL